MTIACIPFRIRITACSESGMMQPTTEATTVEIAEFEIRDDVDEDEFLRAADEMETDLESFSGFVSRELLDGPGRTWVDLLHWQALEEAEFAAEKVGEIPSCVRFFEMMDPDSTGNLRHFEIRRRYTSPGNDADG